MTMTLIRWKNKNLTYTKTNTFRSMPKFISSTKTKKSIMICTFIMTEKEVRGKKVPDQIYVQLVASDPNLPPQDKVVKQGMKSGLSEALDVGVAWLERYLEM